MEKPIVYINCEETLQYSFASHLSVEFRGKGVCPFVNSKGTVDVLERARASVVVLSKDCLSSASCLDKLVMVLQYNMLVVPVFYCISPSDVVVLEHKSSCSVEQIRKWSSVLQDVRELPGHQSREECSDSELVEEIVKDVYEKIFPTEQIGISSRLLEVEQLLCKQPWGIRRIGIWGMPGIGKTTLAKAVFDQISGGYEASCFIKHFDKVFREKGFHRLLEEHFGKILKELPRRCSSITRRSLPGDKLRKKRTLVVLDDVHSPMVTESFLGGFHWFGPGSLIIIISRDKQIFSHCKINHVYEVQSLNGNEAMQLFSHCAFGKDITEEEYLELAMEVIDYASGNPLALSFYGKELKGKKLSDMETSFLKLKLRTSYKIHDLFKSSYETLNENEKNIFLDIACFFKGEDVDYVMPLLEGCGYFPHVGIDVLVEKCLVTISEKRVKMHNIIQDFGREIINGETVHIERRRRLWEPLSIKFLLEDPALGTEDIEGIFLDTANLLFDVKSNAFENMLNLRFLKIYRSNFQNLSGLRLPKGLESLPYELRLLHWEKYPLHYLPKDFDPSHLVELNMSYSQLHKLSLETKDLDMLKIVRLCHSQHLTEIDDIFCKAQNIEVIDLKGCANLHSFPATGQLHHLRVVNLSGCTNIKSFPEVSPNVEELSLQGTGIRELVSIGKATNLKKLYLSGCVSLVKLLASIGDATNLEILDLSYCSSLMKLPFSIGNATNLQELNLGFCSNLVKLPSSIENATNLQNLNVEYCLSLVELSFSIGNVTNLKRLSLFGCSSLIKLPSSIGNATSLQELNLGYCSKLAELPSSIGNATNLQKLNLECCSSLVELPLSIGNAKNLKILCLVGCSSLVRLPSSIWNATNLQELNLQHCSSLVELPSSIWDATNLRELNLEYCSSLVELPSSFENAINLKKIYLAGCSSLVELPYSIRTSSSLVSVDLDENSNLPVVTFSYNSNSRCIEVKRAKRGSLFILKGEQNDEHSVSLILSIVDENGRVRNDRFLFYHILNTSSFVSTKLAEKHGLTKQDVTFIAEMVDVLLVNMIPTRKTDVKVGDIQIKANTQRQEKIAFHDAHESVSHYVIKEESTQPNDFEDLLGMEANMKNNVYSDKVRMKGNWGPTRFETTSHHSNETKSSATATTNSSAEGQSQFSEAVSDTSGGTMSHSGLLLKSPNLKVYSFMDLKMATMNFKPDSMLRQGRFGKVYKGWIDCKTLAPSKAGSGKAVAVKRLNFDSAQGFAEWRSEVNFLGMLSHPNVVKLLGYCREDKELLLVYEFMPNGSLENHLFRRNGPFPWNLRIQIVIGAARGLAYLHSSQREVIYRDFKAANIFLDWTYGAKISDFGLENLGTSQENLQGTQGYAAPEYMATGHLYVKSVVYSFGVVLLEVMTGLRAHDPKRPIGQESLVERLKPELSRKNKVKRIMDQGIKGQYTTQVATEMARITLSCMESDPKNRPSMKEVLDVLEHIKQINIVPDAVGSSSKSPTSLSLSSWFRRG